MVKHTTVTGMQMVTTAGSTATATLECLDRPPIKPVASVKPPNQVQEDLVLVQDHTQHHTQLSPNQVQEDLVVVQDHTLGLDLIWNEANYRIN